jgi:hypothetical protein
VKELPSEKTTPDPEEKVGERPSKLPDPTRKLKLAKPEEESLVSMFLEMTNQALHILGAIRPICGYENIGIGLHPGAMEGLDRDETTVAVTHVLRFTRQGAFAPRQFPGFIGTPIQTNRDGDFVAKKCPKFAQGRANAGCLVVAGDDDGAGDFQKVGNRIMTKLSKNACENRKSNL